MSDKYFLGGAFPSNVDNRDYKVSQLISCAIQLPSEYKTNTPRLVWDQGQSSECVASSLSLVRYLQEYNQSSNRKPFSPSYIYANREDGMYKGEGMYPREALKILQTYGVSFYDDFPGFYIYEDAVKKYFEVKKDLDAKARPFRISSYYAVSSDIEIKSSILQLQAVSAMFPVYDTLYSPDANGKILFTSSMLNERISGYHQMTLVGWTADDYWVIQNSWGDDYGKDGIIYIPHSYPIIEAWAMVDSITEVNFMANK